MLNEKGRKQGEKGTGSRLCSEFEFIDLSADGLGVRESRRKKRSEK